MKNTSVLKLLIASLISLFSLHLDGQILILKQNEFHLLNEVYSLEEFVKTQGNDLVIQQLATEARDFQKKENAAVLSAALFAGLSGTAYYIDHNRNAEIFVHLAENTKPEYIWVAALGAAMTTTVLALNFNAKKRKKYTSIVDHYNQKAVDGSTSLEMKMGANGIGLSLRF